MIRFAESPIGLRRDPWPRRIRKHSRPTRQFLRPWLQSRNGGFFHLQPMTRALVTVGFLVGAYVLEFVWRLFIQAPVAIHGKSQLELIGLREKVSSLEQTKRAPVDLAKLRQIKSILVECEDQG